MDIHIELITNVLDIPGIVISYLVNWTHGSKWPVTCRNMCDAKITLLAIVIVRRDAGIRLECV